MDISKVTLIKGSWEELGKDRRPYEIINACGFPFEINVIPMKPLGDKHNVPRLHAVVPVCYEKDATYKLLQRVKGFMWDIECTMNTKDLEVLVSVHGLMKEPAINKLRMLNTVSMLTVAGEHKDSLNLSLPTETCLPKTVKLAPGTPV